MTFRCLPSDQVQIRAWVGILPHPNQRLARSRSPARPPPWSKESFNGGECLRSRSGAASLCAWSGIECPTSARRSARYDQGAVEVGECRTQCPTDTWPRLPIPLPRPPSCLMGPLLSLRWFEPSASGFGRHGSPEKTEGEGGAAEEAGQRDRRLLEMLKQRRRAIPRATKR